MVQADRAVCQGKINRRNARRAQEEPVAAAPGEDAWLSTYFVFSAASSWRIFAIVAAEGSFRFLFFTRRLGLVE